MAMVVNNGSYVTKNIWLWYGASVVMAITTFKIADGSSNHMIEKFFGITWKFITQSISNFKHSACLAFKLVVR